MMSEFKVAVWVGTLPTAASNRKQDAFAAFPALGEAANVYVH